jgi:hypothetical protein
VFKKTGYSRPHTVHCGPEGIYVSTLGGGGKDGTDGHSISWAAGRSTADPRTYTMISGGTCRATTWFRASGRCCRNSSTGSCRRICSRISMVIGSISGISGPGATSRRSILAPITRWHLRCGPRTIPYANMGSWAWWSTPRASKARSGLGGAKAASFTSRRRRRSRPNRRPRTSCHPSCKVLARYRHW